MSRDPLLALEDIESACSKIVEYTSDLSRDEAFVNSMRLDAVLMNLHIIGEAVKQLPEDLKLRHFDVPWRRISGMRDFIAHVYFALDLDIVWDTISNDVPELLGRIREVITAESEE